MNDTAAPRLIQRAPGASCCCDPAGRICALAVRPVDYGALLRLAVWRGEGTEIEIRARITDMLAGGLLVEL